MTLLLVAAKTRAWTCVRDCDGDVSYCEVVVVFFLAHLLLRVLKIVVYGFHNELIVLRGRLGRWRVKGGD